jgi:hypothetical protein
MGSPELVRNYTSVQGTKVKVGAECEFARSCPGSDNQKTYTTFTTQKKIRCGIAAFNRPELHRWNPDYLYILPAIPILSIARDDPANGLIDAPRGVG